MAKKIWWEVAATEVGGQHTEIIHCKNKREALKLEKEYRANPKYEAAYAQAHNGEEIIDI